MTLSTLSRVGLLAVVAIVGVTAFSGVAAADAPTCTGTSDDFAGGDGSAGTPYQIANVSHLQCLNHTAHLSSDFVLTADVDASNTSSWNNGSGFDPIGNWPTGFNGSFNGQGYTVSDLSIDRPSEDEVGLFGRVGNGSVANVTLENVSVTGGDTRIGGLIGFNVGGTVTNSSAAGTVSGGNNVGGLVGYSDGNVTDSFATVDASGSRFVGGLIGGSIGGSVTNSFATGNVDGNSFVGGLVGWSNVVVTDSYATGTVTGKDSGDANYPLNGECVGGLIGNNGLTGDEGWITNSYATGVVTSIQDVDDIQNVGGLVGCNVGTVTDSYWDVNTTGQDTSQGGTGLTTAEMTGLNATVEMAGLDFYDPWMPREGDYPEFRRDSKYADGADAYDDIVAGAGTQANPYQVTDVYELQRGDQHLNAHFEVQNDIDASKSASWNNGLGFDPIGNDSVPFTGSFDGDDKAISDLVINRDTEDYVGLFSVSNGSIANVALENLSVIGNHHVGGLVGQNRQVATNASVNGTVYGDEFVGGLVGFAGGSVATSSASGTVIGNTAVGGLVGLILGGAVTDSSATGDVNGTERVGGLVGDNRGSITTSYATGSITVDSGFSDVGGLVGANIGSVTDSYWDEDATGQDTSDGGTGLSTAEMTGVAASGNMSFDFTGTWTVTDSYPHLRWAVESVALDLAETTITIGTSTQATVTLALVDGSTVTATTVANYTSDNETVATVDNGTGTVSGNADGTANITADIVGQDMRLLSVVSPAEISLNISTLDFGAVEANANTSARTVRIENTGGQSLTLTGAGVAGPNASEFTVTAGGAGLPTSLVPGATHDITVEFSPGATVGAKAPTLTIETDDPDDPKVNVSLSGTSQDTTDPTAVIGPDKTVDEDTAVSFNASNSTDNVGVDSYDWDFGDGVNATGATPTHTYSQPGIYMVNLTVTDTGGNNATNALTVTVQAVSSGGKNDDDDGDGSRGGQGPAAVEQFSFALVNGAGGTDLDAANVSIKVDFVDDEASGTVTVEPSNALPEDANPITDASGLVFVDVTVPPGLTDSEATMQLTLDANALGDVDPADLAIYHYEDGEWTALDTTVVSTAAGEVVLEATTPGFSLFAVGTVPQQPTPAVTTPDAPDDDTLDDSNPDDGTATPGTDETPDAPDDDKLDDSNPDDGTATPGTDESDDEPGSLSGVALFVLLVGAVVVVALAVVAVRRRS